MNNEIHVIETYDVYVTIVIIQLYNLSRLYLGLVLK